MAVVPEELFLDGLSSPIVRVECGRGGAHGTPGTSRVPVMSQGMGDGSVCQGMGDGSVCQGMGDVRCVRISVMVGACCGRGLVRWLVGSGGWWRTRVAPWGGRLYWIRMPVVGVGDGGGVADRGGSVPGRGAADRGRDAADVVGARCG